MLIPEVISEAGSEPAAERRRLFPSSNDRRGMVKVVAVSIQYIDIHRARDNGAKRMFLRRLFITVIHMNPWLLTVLSLSLSLFFAEALVRLVAPQQLILLRPDIWTPDPRISHRHLANVKTTVNTGEGEVHFETDEDGYRIDATSRSVSSEHAKAILMIGDSFLEALQVESEFTIPQLVARSLRKKTGLSVRVDNAGVGSWNPNHYYVMAQEALKKRKYDSGVVFITIHNDIVDVETETFQPRDPSARHGFKTPQNLSWPAMIDAFLYPANDLLETRSHLFVLFKTISRVQLAKLRLTADRFPPIFDKKEENSPRWRITSHICEKIRNQFAAYGTPVFFVFLPSVYQVQKDMFEEYIRSFSIPAESVDLELPNKILKREFEKRGLVCADPLGSMREKALKGIKMYGLIDRHFSKAGHEAVAEFIQPVVESYVLNEGSKDTTASAAAGHKF